MSRLSKSGSSCSSEEDVEHLRRGPWTDEEDNLLTHYIASHGEGRWNLLANRSGLKRTGKSCRLRWLNYLKPDVKRGNLTPQEQLMILELHSKLGNRWSKIAQHLPGRTDNEIKNYWRTRVQKQARHLKIDSNSTAFQEVIRCFWMPRLLQKIQGPPPSLETPSQNSAKTQPLNHAPPPPPLIISDLTCSFDHQQKNSSLENSTNPNISSSELIHVSQFPQISEYSTSPFDAMGNTDYNTYPKGSFNVDTINGDMETFSLAPEMGDFRDPIGDRHTVDNNWIDDDLADNLWTMDELWQFRQLQEIKGT